MTESRSAPFGSWRAATAVVTIAGGCCWTLLDPESMSRAAVALGFIFAGATGVFTEARDERRGTEVVIAIAGGVFIGSFMLLFSYICLDLDLTVRGSSLVCQEPQHNRCVRHYEVNRRDGGNPDFVSTYIPDSQLQRGTRLIKSRFDTIYSVDGDPHTWDDPEPFVILVMVSAVAFAAATAISQGLLRQ